MTRTPEDVLQEAQTHVALMVQHAQGDLADQLVIEHDIPPILTRIDAELT
jgi:hypothetical protein